MYNIGVLDSGIGGLTTCSEILHKMGATNLFYYADTKNSPYGTKKPHELFGFVEKGMKWCLDRQVDLVVVACNTATAVTIDALRQRYTVPIVGVEPALKLAVKKGGKTLFLATSLTARVKKYLPLIEGFEQNIINIDTEDLAFDIEQSVLCDEALEYLASKIMVGLPPVDNIVLGCTHYCFLRPYLEKLFPQITIFDGNEGVARRVKSFLPNTPLPTDKTQITFHFSGQEYTQKYMRALKKYYNYLK